MKFDQNWWKFKLESASIDRAHSHTHTHNHNHTLTHTHTSTHTTSHKNSENLFFLPTSQIWRVFWRGDVFLIPINAMAKSLYILVVDTIRPRKRVIQVGTHSHTLSHALKIVDVHTHTHTTSRKKSENLVF